MNSIERISLKLTASLSAAIAIINVGLELVKGGVYLWGSLLVALGVVLIYIDLRYAFARFLNFVVKEVKSI